MATSVAPSGADYRISFSRRHRRRILLTSTLLAAALIGGVGAVMHGDPLVVVATGLLAGVAGFLARGAGAPVSPAPAPAPAEPVPQGRDERLEELRRLETVGQLAGGVAHDFNNILTVIGIHSEFLLSGLDPSAPQRADADQIHEATKRASMLTKQLLAFSRRQVLEMTPVSLNDIVRDMTPMLQRLIGEDLGVEVALDPSIGIVLADIGQMQQVIMNLVVNARDAMSNGGMVTISTANVELDATYVLDHTAVTPGDYVMLTVSDTGSGMTPEVRARIFEPFFTTKPPGLGTGLGLATVFGIVRQSGGYVWVYSEPGQGSSFKIYLPVAAGFGHPVRDTDLPIGARGEETILLVEDEGTVREATRRILAGHGYRVVEAANGSEALAVAERMDREIGLLLTDVVMPEAHGPWLVERIAARHPGARILYMSGYTDADITRRGLGTATNTLEKPFSSRTLLRAVRTALDGESRRQPAVLSASAVR